ncbi:MAG: pyruvate kinase [Bacteroidetes bacterium]|nr:MAG: pyruvate kinase [Bacteroidota bacterium]
MEKILTNKTKIVATIGPACEEKEVLKEMILNGMNVARLNFSHGAHEYMQKIINTIRELNEELGCHVAMLADLQGPKLRIGDIENGEVLLHPNDEIIFTAENIIGNAHRVYMSYTDFPKDVNPGEKILIDDGKLIFEVIETDKKSQVKAKVLHGGYLRSKKGVNLPNTKISLPCLTEKDRADLEFILENEISWIGLSFVRSASDIIELKEIIKQHNKSCRVVAKIEKPEAIEDIDYIIKETDAVMVARGDLGVEIPMEKVPLIQKEIVEKSRKASKPVIIATQMMESMINNITPTRAEVNDVANAVTDGADAVMLSGETSVGKYPVEVIKTMYKIVQEAETFHGLYYKEEKPDKKTSGDRYITDSICYSAARLAASVDAKAIITNTFSGYTAFKLAAQRPKADVFVFTANHKILNMLSLIWGVKGFYYDKFVSTDHTIADIKYILKKNGYINDGDYIINIASMPISERGMSNMLKLSEVN